MTHRILAAAIDPRALETAIADASRGAVVTFLGVVRELSDDRRGVIGLEYQAYEPLALETFAQIEDEARARFGDVRLAIAHRVGDLFVGDVAVAVVAAAAHRGAAFDACEYAIDEIKCRAPIWKRERFADGSTQWRENACAASGHNH
jgi:molybdopterin synthase catalytic subunit